MVAEEIDILASEGHHHQQHQETRQGGEAQGESSARASPHENEVARVHKEEPVRAPKDTEIRTQVPAEVDVHIEEPVRAPEDTGIRTQVPAEVDVPEKVRQEEENADAYQYCYSWPVLSFVHAPQRLYHLHQQFKDGLGNGKNNFLKGAKWSPDGSCFLVSSEDCFLRIFDLPSNSDWYGSTLSGCALYADSFPSNLNLCEGESVYDFCWYPQMSASVPGSCVFATTTRDHPVHLWDAITGQLRCSYRAYDAMDEITAAYSVAFDATGAKLFCGYNKTIRVFDTSCPGRDFKQQSTITSTKDGQTGIISSLACNPWNTRILAAGSYDRTTGIYADDSIELLFVLHGQEGGVTQVQFSKDGNYLYTGGRKDPYILCWDLRNTSGIVYKLDREVKDTNQRIYFDIEPCGRHLGSGGQDGQVRIYDLQTGEFVTSFLAAADTCNGFSFHPSLPLGVSTSGHRRFIMWNEESENSDVNNKEEDKEMKVFENCASVWRFWCSWDGLEVSDDIQGEKVDSDMLDSSSSHCELLIMANE